MVVFDVPNLTEKAEPYKPGLQCAQSATVTLPRPCRPPAVSTCGGRRNLHNGEYREASTRDAPPERHNPGRIYEVRL